MLSTRLDEQNAVAEDAFNSGLVRAISQSLTDAVALSDEHGVVLAVNSAYTKLYGLTERDALGRSFPVIFPETQHALTQAAYSRAFWGDAPTIFTASSQAAGGAERRVELRIAFVYRADARVAMLSVIRDITAGPVATTFETRAPTILHLDSLESLYEAHARASIGYAYALLGDIGQVEVVVEETLLAIWRAGVGAEKNHSVARLLLLSVLRRIAGEAWLTQMRSRREAQLGPSQAESLGQWWTPVPS